MQRREHVAEVPGVCIVHHNEPEPICNIKFCKLEWVVGCVVPGHHVDEAMDGSPKLHHRLWEGKWSTLRVEGGIPTTFVLEGKQEVKDAPEWLGFMRDHGDK